MEACLAFSTRKYRRLSSAWVPAAKPSEHRTVMLPIIPAPASASSTQIPTTSSGVLSPSPPWATSATADLSTGSQHSQSQALYASCSARSAGAWLLPNHTIAQSDSDTPAGNHHRSPAAPRRMRQGWVVVEWLGWPSEGGPAPPEGCPAPSDVMMTSPPRATRWSSDEAAETSDVPTSGSTSGRTSGSTSDRTSCSQDGPGSGHGVGLTTEQLVPDPQQP